METTRKTTDFETAENDKQFCECCGRELDLTKIVWIAAYGEDQGFFAFGAACAKRWIKKNG
jgi:hypothetical protein